MRIIYLHQYFNTPEMSGGTRSYEMAKRLVSGGHTVDMITSDCRGGKSGDIWRISEEAGIRVHWTPVLYSNETGYSARIRAFLTFAQRAARRAASLSADVVFATSTPLTIAVPGVYASRRLSAPMVLEVRDLWPEVPIEVGALRDPFTVNAARWLEQFAYRNADRIIALSPGMQDGITARGYPSRHVAVIPNSCDMEFFEHSAEQGRAFRARHSELKDKKLVVYCGTLGLVNGVDYLVRVAAELRDDPELCFLVVGGGRCSDEVRQLAHELNVLDHNFVMLDRMPKQEIPAVLGAADMAVSTFIDLPCLRANSANKFFDGLAAGKPMLINYKGWQAELLEETGAGLVLPAHDHQRAALMIRQAMSDPVGLKNMGGAAQQLARERFQRDDLAAEFERVLLDAVNAHERRGH